VNSILRVNPTDKISEMTKERIVRELVREIISPSDVVRKFSQDTLFKVAKIMKTTVSAIIKDKVEIVLITEFSKTLFLIRTRNFAQKSKFGFKKNSSKIQIFVKTINFGQNRTAGRISRYSSNIKSFCFNNFKFFGTNSLTFFFVSKILRLMAHRIWDFQTLVKETVERYKDVLGICPFNTAGKTHMYHKAIPLQIGILDGSAFCLGLQPRLFQYDCQQSQESKSFLVEAFKIMSNDEQFMNHPCYKKWVQRNDHGWNNSLVPLKITAMKVSVLHLYDAVFYLGPNFCKIKRLRV